MLDLKFGKVCNIDDNGRVRVLIAELDNFTTDFLPVAVCASEGEQDGNWLKINQDAAVLLNDGEDGIVFPIRTDANPLAIKDKNKRYYTFDDGAHFEYDRAAHKLTLNLSGETDIQTLDIKINGKSLLEWARTHTHGNGNNGADTTAPKTTLG
jgi:phage baseplate assembly protein V